LATYWFALNEITPPNKRFQRTGISVPLIDNLPHDAVVARPLKRRVSHAKHMLGIDLNTLYEMARVAADGAARACDTSAPRSEQIFYEAYGGYPVYIDEYNRLATLAGELFGAEAQALFQPVDLKKAVNPADVSGMMWRTYADLAAVRLGGLAAYLKSKLKTPDREVDSIIDLVSANLRASIFSDPEKEVEVQNALEVIFRARGLDFRREKIVIEYSSKRFIPDFTFESADLALEVKLCKSPVKEKALVDEINADILAYQTRYARCIFVVYDLGHIRDVGLFKSSIEKNLHVHLLVIKK